jgi:hypothetical protein
MPLLIYDDTCYHCGRFAQAVRRLSRGRIEIIGHYSREGMSVKSKIFPEGFDSTTMSWLVKDKQAFGGRNQLIPIAVEIVKGIVKPSSKNDIHQINLLCSNEELSCSRPNDFVKRVCMLIKSGKKMNLENNAQRMK